MEKVEKDPKEEIKEEVKKSKPVEEEITKKEENPKVEVKDTVTKVELDEAWARFKKEKEKNERLESIAQENTQLKEELKKIAEEKQKAEDARLKKKEEYKTLAEQKEEALKAIELEKEKLAADNTTLLSSLELLYEEMLEEIPEERRTLIPTSLGITDKMKYLTDNRKFLIPEKNSATVLSTTKTEADMAVDDRTALMNRMKELNEAKSKGKLNFSEKKELWELIKKIPTLS
jgi:hypothetical protein